VNSMFYIEKSRRWPIIIVFVLGTTISVNILFAWIALTDQGGGFEIVVSENDDASYKRKLPLSHSPEVSIPQ
jgi:hypothetical protein